MTTRTATHNPVGRLAHDHPTVVRLGRVGWFAKGIVYVLAGGLALVIVGRSFGWTATSGAAGEASPTGAVKEIAATSGGPFLLVALAVGMLLYAAWRVVTALLPGSTDAEGWATRLGYGVSAIIYASLAVTAVSLARNPVKQADGNQTVSDATARFMQHTGGRWLIGLVGAVVIGAGLYRIKTGLTGDATKSVNMGGMAAERARWTRRLGTVGEVGRGIGIGLIGFFLLRAAITFNAAEATGLDGALRRLAIESWGVVLVAIVGVGFLAYGLFCMATFARQRLQAP